MARPAGISSTVEKILQREAQRLEEKSEKTGLTDEELLRMKELLAISKLLTGGAPQGGEQPELDVNSIAAKFTAPPKDRTLFPKPGPKATSKIYEPDEGPA